MRIFESARIRGRLSDAEQDDLFEDQPTPVYHADPDQVRADLYRILAEARAARKMPWEPKRVSLYRTIFPQMTNWLPEEVTSAIAFRIRDRTGAVGRSGLSF
jgi:hypothetical protein